MKTRMRTGTTVQTTSITVLWVVFDGIGLRFSLKRHDHVEQQPQDEGGDHGDDHQQDRCGNASISSMTGEAAGWKPICQGSGFAAQAPDIVPSQPEGYDCNGAQRRPKGPTTCH